MAKPPTTSIPTVNISDIVVPPDRARVEFNHLEDMAKSIRENGLINPVMVRPRPDGKYDLIAGERRFRSFAMAGVGPNIPVHIRENVSDLELKVLELEENVQRQNLTWQEEINNLKQIDELRRQLSAEEGKQWTLEDTGNISGESKSSVSIKINLAKKLEDDPELREAVKGLPLSYAVKKVKDIEEAKRYQRIHESKKKKAEETGEELKLLDFQNLHALDYLKTLEDNSIDLILTDPPFGLDQIEDRRKKVTPSTTQSYIGALKDSDNMSTQEAFDLVVSTLPEFHRVLKPGSHFYIFFEFGRVSQLVEAMPKGLTVQWPLLIWDKGRTTAAFNGYRYSPCAEAIIFGYKEPRNRRLEKSAKQILQYSPIHSKRKIHPFEKPPALLMFLIQQSTFIGSSVLDPFAGSGSTLKAAIKCGRVGRGSEVDPDNFAAANARLYSDEEVAVEESSDTSAD